ncbi:nose resistant to fluoxetine protein 6-like [Diadema setosum]|uniref:nose resistant to fluoxetine protein 6-like n=1 Tax=Diadema setosum TaxID=31175 RepID=UPI003B3AA586
MSYEHITSLSKNNSVFLKTASNQLTDIVNKAPVRQTVSGERAFVLVDDALLSDRCYTDLMQYLTDIRNDVYYARRMYTSHGDLPSEKSLYTYNFQSYGDIWLCTSNKANETSGVPSFDAQYCLFQTYLGACRMSGVVSVYCSRTFVVPRLTPTPIRRSPSLEGFSHAQLRWAVNGREDLVDIVSTYQDKCLSEGDVDDKKKYCLFSASGLGLMTWGTCFPNTCSQAEIKAVSDEFWLALGAPEPFGVYECMGPEPWRKADIAFLSILSLLALMVVVGSFYDVFLHKLVLKKIVIDTDNCRNGSALLDVTNTAGKHRIALPSSNPQTPKSKEQKNEKPQIRLGWAILDGTMMSFSAVTNGRKLLSAKKAAGNMAVLNGLRVISMFWIILGHTCQFNIPYIDNDAQAIELTSNFGFLGVVNASFSVDTFFVMSGFLVTFFTLRQIAKKNMDKVYSWGIFYFHRWWRLTPPYAAAMGIWALLKPHFAQGPRIDAQHELVRTACRETWWAHFLYINNLYPWPGELIDTCMGWSWYLANDMQFYIISPFILLMLYRNGKTGLALLTSLLVASLACNVGLNWYYGYNFNPYGTQPLYNNNTANNPAADNIYGKPYTRIVTYILGMFLGFVIYNLKDKKITIHWVVVVALWLCALGTMFGAVYGIWSSHDRYIEQWESVIYLSFSRFAWGLAICWIIFACLFGYGGPIGSLLEMSLWVPLAKLTYCAYLIHLVIVISQVDYQKTLSHYDPLTYIANCDW